MSTGYLVSLTAAAALVLAVSGFRRNLSMARLGSAWVPVGPAGVAAFTIGVIALAFHCGAMFFRGAAVQIPAARGVVDRINGMGLPSQLLFVAPTLLVLVALRRQPRVLVAIVAAALAAVGVTMYDSGPLTAHLTAIFAAVIVLAAVSGFQVRPSVDG